MGVLGNLLKLIAIGAFFVATGTLGGLAAGPLRTAIGLGGVVLNAIGNALNAPNLLQERQKITIGTTLEPSTPLPVVFGRATVGAI